MAEYPDYIRFAQTVLAQQGEINALKVDLATARQQLADAHASLRAFVEPGGKWTTEVGHYDGSILWWNENCSTPNTLTRKVFYGPALPIIEEDTDLART